MQSVSRCAVIRFKPNVYRTSVGYVRGFHKTSRNQHGGHSHGSPVFEQNEQARKACEKITKVGMITNGVLMIGKAAAGVFGGSHALIADAAHSLSDFGSDLVTLYVVNQVRKPHTPLYPYGLVNIYSNFLSTRKLNCNLFVFLLKKVLDDMKLLVL